MPSCDICKHLCYEAPCSSQPYPEAWCSKGVFDCPDSTEQLTEETDCEQFEVERPPSK